MWLLRDFALDLSVEGKQITPTEYLENTLLPIQVTLFKNILRREKTNPLNLRIALEKRLRLFSLIVVVSLWLDLLMMRKNFKMLIIVRH
jgi:hypothetical protein